MKILMFQHLINICWKTKVREWECVLEMWPARQKKADKMGGRKRKVIVWRRGETDGESQGKRAGWKTDRWWRRRAGAEEEEGRFGGEGFPDEAQLTVQTYSALMTGLTTSTRWHYYSAVRGPGPTHTHTHDLLHRAALPACVISDSGMNTKCLFMLLQSGIHTHKHQLIKHYSFYTGYYVLWLLASVTQPNNPGTI